MADAMPLVSLRGTVIQDDLADNARRLGIPVSGVRQCCPHPGA
jgi:hypothetical protein